jgi:hypothetical protein
VSIYHDGSRELQDRFDSRRIADRLEEVNLSRSRSRTTTATGCTRASATCSSTRASAERIFFNCPRYLHRMELGEYSKYAPRADHTPPVPDWKLRPEYRDHLPARDLAALDEPESRSAQSSPTRSWPKPR